MYFHRIGIEGFSNESIVFECGNGKTLFKNSVELPPTASGNIAAYRERFV